MTEKNWHVLGIEEVIEALKTSQNGLTIEHVEYRQRHHGLNELKKIKKISPLSIFFKQFKDFLIIILLIATLVSAIIGEVLDAVVILSMVVALFEMFNAFNSRSDRRSIFDLGFFSNRWLNLAVLSSLILMVVIIQIPSLGSLFHVMPLRLFDWILALLIGSSALVVGEVWKFIMNKWKW